MTTPAFSLDTTAALKYAGIDRRRWDHMMQQKTYSAAPPVEAGHPRNFTRDDIVSLFVLQHYLGLGLGPAIAGRVASAFAVEIRKAGEDVDYLYVVTTGEGRPVRVITAEPSGPIASHRFPVGELRRKIEDFAARSKL